MMKLHVVQDIIPGAVLASIGEDELEAVLAAVMDGARAYWIQQAQRGLKSSRVDYIQGIQPVNRQGLVASIDLVGVLPNMVEQGVDGWDLRETLLQDGDPNVKRNKDGRKYRSIPFRHQTPGTQGQGGGVPMGDPYKDVVENAERLGREIYAAAKKLRPGQGLAEGFAPKLKPHHTTDIYAGMQRMQAKGKSQVHYKTFRTISEDSDPQKWQHPGIEPHNFAESVERYILDVSEKAFGSLIP